VLDYRFLVCLYTWHNILLSWSL